jgi:RNA ligase (TIGR02306 family)
MGRGGNKGLLLTEQNQSVKVVQNEIPDLVQDTFQVQARKVTILPHPNADAIELAKVDDYLAIVKKGEYQTGDTVIYIPEAAIVPNQIIKDLGLEGRLAGGTVVNGKKLKNRVKAIRLRGTISQGLIYKPDFQLVEGQDYQEQLGITKWSPPIPRGMSGQLKRAPISSYTKIQNIKKYPNVFKEGEPIVFTEKLHGTCTVTALVNNQLYVSSKGLSSKSLSLERQLDDQGNDKNVYWNMVEKYQLENKLRFIAEQYNGKEIYIFGETLGVQDIKYGNENGQLDFRGFDIRVDGSYLDYDQQKETFESLGIPVVPELYRGAYDKQVIEDLASGCEVVTGKQIHLREGGVLKPIKERLSEQLEGRAILKVISPDYLLRKGEATEYE